MSPTSETLADETQVPSPTATQLVPESLPVFLERAARILAGHIRAEDYLQLTPDIEEAIARDLATAEAHVRTLAERGQISANLEFADCVHTRQRNERLLSAYHGGQNIACIEDAHGVIVLAVGLEETRALLDAFPYELRAHVLLETPDATTFLR
jgi:hypothetical protein